MATLEKPVNIIVSKQVERLAILKNWRSLHLQFRIFVSRKECGWFWWGGYWGNGGLGKEDTECLKKRGDMSGHPLMLGSTRWQRCCFNFNKWEFSSFKTETPKLLESGQYKIPICEKTDALKNVPIFQYIQYTKWQRLGLVQIIASIWMCVSKP